MIDTNMIQAILPEDLVLEMILVTVRPSGEPNAAPVGVVRNEMELTLELAENTTSSANILATGKGNLCLVRDPLIFAKAAFDMPLGGLLGAEQLEGIPVISGGTAVISARLLRSFRQLREDKLGPTAFTHVALEPIEARLTGMPIPHSRRYCAAIEAIIHTTRARIAQARDLEDALHEYSRKARREIERARRTGNDQATEKALALCLENLSKDGGEVDSRK